MRERYLFSVSRIIRNRPGHFACIQLAPGLCGEWKMEVGDAQQIKESHNVVAQATALPWADCFRFRADW